MSVPFPDSRGSQSGSHVDHRANVEEGDSVAEFRPQADTDPEAELKLAGTPASAKPPEDNTEHLKPTAPYDYPRPKSRDGSHIFDARLQFSSASDPGIELGQYSLVEQLGRGGMGIVFRGVHRKLKKSFAVKILSAGLTADPKAVARFHREMEAVGRLDHENIVRATDAGEVGGVHYLAMELIDGSDLAQVLRSCGPLAPAEACEIVRQTAAGLQSAHESSLVHRDIKPSNLLLSRAGQVKILDLGLARLTQVTPSPSDLSGAGQVMGTPDYMAPEQWDAYDSADIRSDLYSLGCTLYTLLAGRPPFGTAEYDSHSQKMVAHCRDTPVPISSLRIGLPKGLAGVLERSMAKAPAQRYATPAALIADIEKYAAGADLKGLAQRSSRAIRSEAGATVTHRDLPSATPRRRARFWQLAGALTLTAVVATILGLMLIPNPLPAKPTEPGAALPTQPDGKRVPGVWYDLLDREPTPLVWPKDDKNSTWTYDPLKKEVVANSSGMGLFQLAEIEGDSFELEATIFQNPWSGSFGLYYFGTTDVNGKITAQTVHVEKFLRDPQAMRTARVTLSWTGVSSPSDHYFNRAVAAEIEQPIAGDVRLKLKVAGGKLVAGEWANAPLQETILNRTTNPISPVGRSGVGFFTASATTAFRSVQIRTAKP